MALTSARSMARPVRSFLVPLPFPPLFLPRPDTDLTPDWLRLQPMLRLEEADY